jgi:hypothetical protein
MNLDPDEFEARLARQLNDLADTPLPGRKSIAEVTSAAVRDRGPVSTSVLVATALLLAVGAVLFAVRADLRWPGPSPAEGEGLGSIPAGITADQWNYCMTKAVTGWQSSMGPETVEEVGRNYLGWDTELANREELMSAAELAAHPEGGLACRVANELFALSEPEWNWCYDEANRAAFLVPAIAALGLGEDEARSPAADGLAEAPGDDVPEYVFACRFAFQYWREEGVSEVVSPASHPYFALTADRGESPVLEDRGRVGVGATRLRPFSRCGWLDALVTRERRGRRRAAGAGGGGWRAGTGTRDQSDQQAHDADVSRDLIHRLHHTVSRLRRDCGTPSPSVAPVVHWRHSVGA